MAGKNYMEYKENFPCVSHKYLQNKTKMISLFSITTYKKKTPLNKDKKRALTKLLVSLAPGKKITVLPGSPLIMDN